MLVIGATFILLLALPELEVESPDREDGRFDIVQQRVIAAAKRFDNIRQHLAELGEWSCNARIAYSKEVGHACRHRVRRMQEGGIYP